MKPQPKTNQQCRKMWALAKEHGLDGEALHEVVYAVTRSQHISTLTVSQAAEVISALERMAPTGRCSDGLRKKILALMYSLGWNMKQLRGFIKRQTGGISDLRWLDTRQAGKVIEGLKAMKAKGIYGGSHADV